MKLMIFQPNEVIERQNKFMKETYPFAQSLKAVLYFIAAYCISLWLIDTEVTLLKYIGILVYLTVFILKWYYYSEYDKQAEEQFKRKWGTVELNKKNIERWLCENTSFHDNNVTIGSMSFFFVVYAVGSIMFVWAVGCITPPLLRIIYYLIGGAGMIVRITFEGTHPALATIKPEIDLAIGVATIILMYFFCLITSHILSFKIIKCGRGENK